MVASELVSIISGALGLGGAVVALYIRATISETIIQKLNGRYMGSSLCIERHANLTQQLANIERQTDRIDKKVELGFDAIRAQLHQAQTNREDIVREHVRREHEQEAHD
jgi:hypothetical protein